ncbi:MAG TPA: DUF4097 family beta strand repeat-containing protein [Candidatus Saccharimonadales bacterium]|nr:DUF4097 family beta strand repeat-containing protein [Candidatus Saccharimonadales bacterium]
MPGGELGRYNSAASDGSIPLPGLYATEFDLTSAGVEVVRDYVDRGDVVPEAHLTLSPGLVHDYTDGVLTVREEAPNLRTMGSDFFGAGDVHGGVFINDRDTVVGNIVFGNKHVTTDEWGNTRTTYSGAVFSRGMSGAAEQRALLEIPDGVEIVAQDIRTASGDVKLEGVSPHALRIASASGAVALEGLHVDQMQIKTATGKVQVTDTTSQALVDIKSVSGDIRVIDGDAPAWRLTTVSGDIKTENTQGNISSRSVSGRITRT